MTKPAKTKVKPTKDAEKLAAATEAAASGALIEPAIVAAIDTSHPAVDDNPRDRSTADMNRIDFNTPSALTSQEAEAAKALTEQGEA